MSQDGNDGIRWVGQQWQMEGYCGREMPADVQVQTANANDAKPLVEKTKLKIARSKVVRIGPRTAETRSAAA